MEKIVTKLLRRVAVAISAMQDAAVKTMDGIDHACFLRDDKAKKRYN